jgi:hypothetical protein
VNWVAPRAVRLRLTDAHSELRRLFSDACFFGTRCGLARKGPKGGVATNGALMGKAPRHELKRTPTGRLGALHVVRQRAERGLHSPLGRTIGSGICAAASTRADRTAGHEHAIRVTIARQVGGCELRELDARAAIRANHAGVCRGVSCRRGQGARSRASSCPGPTPVHRQSAARCTKQKDRGDGTPKVHGRGGSVLFRFLRRKKPAG